MELFNADGSRAGILDIVAWWVEKYPEDEWHGAEVFEIRKQMLEMAKRMLEEVKV